VSGGFPSRRIQQRNLILCGIHRPFKTPAVFAVAPLGAVSAVFLMLGLPGDTWLRLAVWLIIGLAIYFFYGRNHSHLTRRR
jgi:APA family basic amino acid/polyamine antiporter